MILHHHNLELHYLDTLHQFQILHFVLTGNGVLEPHSLQGLQLPPLDYRRGVLLSGKGPVWLFAYLAHLCHPAAWVAIFDPRLGGVVVQNHIASGPQPGSLVVLEQILPFLKTQPGNDPPPVVTLVPHDRSAVVAIVGPPHSGKSVFLHTLQRDLHERMGNELFQRTTFVLRGAPDGEGNWFHEISPGIARIIRHKGAFDDSFVEQFLSALRNVRSSKRLVLIDCGGKIDPRNQRIWNECTHAIIVSHDPHECAHWRGAVEASGLQVMAEMQSTTKSSSHVLSENPLSLVLGPLERHAQTANLPRVLLERIISLVPAISSQK